GLPAARGRPPQWRAVHRSPVAAEARHDRQEGREGPQGPRTGHEPLSANAGRGVAAVLRTLPAHLRAKLAMFMVVTFAFCGTRFANPRAQLEHLAKQLLGRPPPPVR